jgi:hypothetical protein
MALPLQPASADAARRRHPRLPPPAACSVYVRVRPLNEAERERGAAWRVEANGMAQVDPATEARLSDTAYKLDAIFDGGQPTSDVYEQTTQGLIRQVVNGFNSTVFAYGQTSSGKTHTMKGTPGEPGIIPLAVREVFQLIAACQDREFLLRVSYMEVGAALGGGCCGLGPWWWAGSAVSRMPCGVWWCLLQTNGSQRQL